MTKLTPEQRKFADNHEFSDDELNVISYIDTQLAIKGNYLNYMDIVDALATIGSWDTSPEQKMASKLLLRYVFPKKFVNDMIEEYAVVTDRESFMVRRWRQKVLKRDNNICQHCGSTENLCAHHISYWSNDPINRVNVDNGITLCQECHAKEHLGEPVYYLIAKQR